jgi:hypothetical protein
MNPLSYNVILDKTGDKNVSTIALAEGIAQSESISTNYLKRDIAFRLGENSQTYKSFQAAVEVAVSDLDVSQSNEIFPRALAVLSITFVLILSNDCQFYKHYNINSSHPL